MQLKFVQDMAQMIAEPVRNLQQQRIQKSYRNSWNVLDWNVLPLHLQVAMEKIRLYLDSVLWWLMLM